MQQTGAMCLALIMICALPVHNKPLVTRQQFRLLIATPADISSHS